MELIIGREEVKIDPDKVMTEQDRRKPLNTFNIPSFVRIAYVFRVIIRNLSGNVLQLKSLTRKDVKFRWSKDYLQLFETLKEPFVMVLFRVYLDWMKMIVVVTNALNWVLESVLSQSQDNEVLHSVVFYSKKHSTVETNYNIYDKDVLAIVRVFKESYTEPEPVNSCIQVIYDQRSLYYFISKKNLSRQQTQ